MLPVPRSGLAAGDFLTEPVAKGGIDLGTAGSPAVPMAVLIGAMGYANVAECRSLAVPGSAGREGRARRVPPAGGLTTSDAVPAGREAARQMAAARLMSSAAR
ncbi:hypothetical protein ABZT04_25405 [Streptomyces sp. NPDC005492]|uniref:hypothetical protein n=1 Tax=Streptomyces sp. NPDC005492 TaxID=3156883 RepID=UPI0033AD7484